MQYTEGGTYGYWDGSVKGETIIICYECDGDEFLQIGRTGACFA